MSGLFFYSVSGCSSGDTVQYVQSDFELVVDSVYAILFAGNVAGGCYTIVEEVDSEGTFNSISSASLIGSCEECGTFTESPVNSGNYSYEWCDSCDNGSTKTSTELPHPIAISQDGLKEIIQITSVTIGGPNGLNY